MESYSTNDPKRRRLRTIGFVIAMAVAVGGCTYTQLAPPPYDAEYATPDPEPPTHYGEEFPVLLEYGRWVHTGPYGWVWSPFVDISWRPYVHGHWAWTDWGWTWVSYEPYGWAVYHYGYWVFDTIWGWIWIPGYEWSPHRVQWVMYDDYICWAPLPPPGVYYFGDPWASPIDDIWIVCEPEYFMHVDLGRYVRHSFRPPPPAVHQRVAHASPSVDFIRVKTRNAVPKVVVDVSKYKVGDKELTRMKLPPDQARTVERYQPKTIRKVHEPGVLDRTPTEKSREAVRPTEEPREKRQKEKQPGDSDKADKKNTGKDDQRKKDGKKKQKQDPKGDS